ncbi:LytR C-terminal domain-containing protein [Arthrobacter sp.]|uniref:LytR C-terminal domain-containing protein n=1 Tax=Arthrobacter sp. TaxID=1667 RepID=UPI003A922EBF
MPRDKDTEDWHGHRIVTEDDLAEGFTDHDPEHVDNPRYYRRRLLHGIVLGVLAAVLIAALVLAYLVKTRQVVIPALEPPAASTAAAPTHDPIAAACPQEMLPYAQPKDVTVNVLNGTKTPGLAGATAQVLKQRGFRIGDVGNAKLNNSKIVAAVVSGTSGRSKALTVQRQLPGTEYVKDAKRSADTVDLIIGDKYNIKKILPKGKAKTRDGRLSCPLAVKAARVKAQKEAASSEAAASEAAKP